VPISRLADCILATQEDLRASNITAGIVGHVGDGNFHVIVLIDPAKPEERTAAEGINDRLTDRALAMEGTCTGEHGIGLHKMRFLALEHDAAAIDLMRAVKIAFDPKNILNPGKIFASLPAQPV
jgi:D-lactate dehydrogenase (cytochrome)